MVYELIVLTVEDGVAWLTLNRPKRGNAITPEMGNEIKYAIDWCERNQGVRVIAIQGAGKFFCTGMDLGNVNQSKVEEELKNGIAGNRSFELFQKIKQCSKPTIAVINGPVYGGGCGLVFVCDIRISIEKSFLCFSEVKRGIVPALISAFIVPQLGEYLSNVYMMTGKKLTVEQLFQLGLISDLAKDKEELKSKAISFANEIQTSAPGAVARTKENVQYCAGHSSEENASHVKEVFAETVQSDEAIYGVGCFMQKQKPDWNEFMKSKL